jgi:predicted transcriptional regulator
MDMIFQLLRVGANGSRLGPLEQRILRALWRLGDVTVQDLIDGDHMPLAYTTVSTILDRLWKKGLANRVAEAGKRKGMRFRYEHRYTKAELERKVAVETIKLTLSLGAGHFRSLTWLRQSANATSNCSPNWDT